MIQSRNINKRRNLLYKKYIKELSRYDSELKYFPGSEVIEWAKEYYEDKQNTSWIDIIQDDQIVGFLIITHKGGDCHPDCDHFIAQAYVLPEKRNQGLMTAAVTRYLQNNPGIYGYDVIIGNRYAKNYWKKYFTNFNAKYIPLKRYRSEELESKLELYGCIV